MKHVVLTNEEAKLLEAIEKGEFVQVKNIDQEKKNAVAVVKNTLNKTKNINIRLSEKDITKLKAKAVETGIPYQTMVSSILHRFANNTLNF